MDFFINVSGRHDMFGADGIGRRLAYRRHQQQPVSEKMSKIRGVYPKTCFFLLSLQRALLAIVGIVRSLSGGEGPASKGKERQPG